MSLNYARDISAHEKQVGVLSKLLLSAFELFSLRDHVLTPSKFYYNNSLAVDKKRSQIVVSSILVTTITKLASTRVNESLLLFEKSMVIVLTII